MACLLRPHSDLIARVQTAKSGATGQMLLAFSDRHYIPILKTKQGERWSLATLPPDLRAVITPLLELHPHKTLDSTQHAASVCEELVGDWGVDLAFFLDTRWLHGEAGSSPIAEAAFQAARDNGLQAIPVIRPALGPQVLEVIGAIVEEDQRGVLMRVLPSDLTHPEAILGAVQSSGLAPAETHLLLDYRSQQMNLSFDLPRIPALTEWKTFSAASGSFPRSLADRPLDQWVEIQRLDWQSWLQGRQETRLRRPSFGDYATRDPGPAAQGGKASVNLRYCLESTWLCRVGGRLEDGAAPQMRNFCALLVADARFSGRTFSAGDAEIFNKTLPDTGTGGPAEWAKWSLSHHIVFAGRQIQGLADA
jgi:Beta protein